MAIKNILFSIVFVFATSAALPVSAQTVMATPTTTPTPVGTVLRMNGAAPSGLSSYLAATSSGTTTTYPTIFASTTGAVGGCALGATPVAPTSTTTCNSCTTALKACSLTSIHPELLLTIPLISNTAATFTLSPFVKFKLGSDTTLYSIDNAPTLASGQAFTAQILWSNLCARINGDRTCANASGRYSFSIGIDNNNDNTFEEKIDFNLVIRYVDGSVASPGTACIPPVAPTNATDGICYFKLFKGDEKIYIQDFAASSNSLATPSADIKYDRMVMFYEAGINGAPANPASVSPVSPSKILLLQNNGADVVPGIEDRRMRGLTNGTEYCFLLGNMDQTGIVSKFVDSTLLLDRTLFCQTPEEVVGLLDDKNCFIASATFGSQMAPEVVTFRKFRNEFLLTNSAGKAFVRAYYKYGPVGARWISESPTLKIISLGILWPLLLLVKLSLALGLIPAILIVLLGTLTLTQSLVRLRRVRARLL